MNRPLRILHLEDSKIDAELVRTRLEDEGVACTIDWVETREAFAARLEQGGIDVILADYTLPSFDGLTALAMARATDPDLPVIFVSGTIGEDRAVETYKNGATDYVLKSHLSRLAPAMLRALREAEEHRERKLAEEALRGSEERYRSLFENMLDGFAHCRMIYEDGQPRDFVYLDVNSAFERLTGLKDVIGKKVTEAIPGIRETDPGLFEIYGRVALTGKPERFEMYVKALSTWFFISVYSPRREHFVAVFDVITERKRAEQEREITIEFLRLVNESADTRGLIRAATTFFQQQSGCEAVGVRLRVGEDYPYYESRGFPKEFVVAENSLCARDSANCVIRDSKGDPVIECMCGNVICGRFDPARSFFTSHGSFWSNNTTELLRTTTEADRQARTRNRCNGSGYESVALLPLRAGEVRLGLLQLNDRRPGVFSLEAIGLWERLADQLAVALAKFQAEEATRKSEKRYQDLFDSTLDGIFQVNAEGVFILMNPAGARVFGHESPEEIIGRNAQEYWRDPKDRDAYKAELKIQKKLSAYPMRAKKKSGEPIELESSARTMEDEKGNFLGIEGILRDVTVRKQAEEALQQSEEKYRHLVENLGKEYFFYRHDTKGVFTYISSSVTDMLGYSLQEALTHYSEYLTENPINTDALRHTDMSIQGIQQPPYEVEIFHRDGSTRWLEVSEYAVRERDGSVIAVEGIARDITERKRAEEELRTSVQMWNNTFDAMNEAISIMDAEGKLLRNNKTMLSLLGTNLDEVVDRTHWEIMHPAEGQHEECAFSRMQKSLRREHMTFRFQKQWFSVTADPIIDHLGKLAGGVYVMTDITESKQVDEQLRESESKFKSLAEQSLVGTYIIQDGKFKYVNPRLAEMYAYPVEDIVDRKGPLDLVVPDDHHLVAENMKRRLSDKTPSSHYEARGRRRTGELIHIEIFGSTTTYQGRPAIIGVVLDITEKNKLESQLLQAQKMEAVGQLTGGIAHDFNNILSAIIGYASLLQMKMAGGDPLRSFVDQILAGADRAANLTRSLLTFSRKQVSNQMSVDVNAIIGRVEKLLHGIIGEDIDLRLALTPGELVVDADAGQLEQVLMNLATNARDAMPKGGILSVESATVESGDVLEQLQDLGSKKYALISVTDTGVGMDEKTREKIFEPFFTTKDLGRGTGLGLSMVYGIIKQHKGHIHCYSEPGKGTTFKVYLPLLHSAEGGGKMKVTTAAADELQGGHETILVAEDDDTLRDLVKTTLQDFGYTVIAAVDGEDAVGQFRQNKDAVNLVLCDVIMPKKTGGEVRDEIKKTSPDAKIIFMSGYPADIVHQKGLLEGEADIVLKPIPPTVLLRKVREVLDKR
jgi:PAS domain S-box-containing protein